MVKVVPFGRLGVCLTADNNGMNGGRIQAADEGGGTSRRRLQGVAAQAHFLPFWG
jgi:hypothetical protein